MPYEKTPCEYSRQNYDDCARESADSTTGKQEQARGKALQSYRIDGTVCEKLRIPLFHYKSALEDGSTPVLELLPVPSHSSASNEAIPFPYDFDGKSK